MAIFLEYPLPDELLISVVAAYVRHHNVCNVPAFCQRLFGDDGGLPLAIVRNLQHIASETRQCWHMTPDEIRDRLTLFPYFSALWSKQKARNVASFCLLAPDTGKSSEEWRVSYMHTLSFGLGIRHCTECWSQDDVNGTRRYWRRAHQLPGVTTCHVHGCLLYSIGVGGSRMFVKDKPFVGRVLEGAETPFQHAVQQEGSLLSAKILEQGAKAVRFGSPEARIDCLRVLGYGADNLNLIDKDRVVLDIVDTFGRRYLDNTKFLPRGDRSWVHGALFGRRTRTSTLVDVLMEVFLSQGMSLLTCAPGPVCRSARSFNDPDHTIVIGDAEEGIFHCFCSCGYSFLFEDHEDRGTRRREPTHAGPDFVRAAGVLTMKGWPDEKVADAFGIEHGNFNRWLRFQTEAGDRTQCLKRARIVVEWVSLVDRCGSPEGAWAENSRLWRYFQQVWPNPPKQITPFDCRD